jgi:hypothetical protein
MGSLLTVYPAVETFASVADTVGGVYILILYSKIGALRPQPEQWQSEDTMGRGNTPLLMSLPPSFNVVLRGGKNFSSALSLWKNYEQ